MGQPITQTIQELHEKLDQRLHQPHVTPREICDLADALARCYAVLGDVTSAQRFFAQAAEAAFAWIEHPNYPKVHGRPDGNSRHILRCARLLWRANDTRASQYFHQAISIAETGIDVQSYRLRCSPLLAPYYVQPHVFRRILGCSGGASGRDNNPTTECGVF
jgi:hypothetical protein